MARINKLGIIYAVLVVGLNACSGQTFPEAICERVNITHAGKPVIGVEDMAYDAQSQTLYLSAYDRRTHSKGGIYRLPTGEAAATPNLIVTPVIANIRPHGIDLTRDGPNLTLSFIDRQGSKNEKKPVIRTVSWQDGAPTITSEAPPIDDPKLCASNDLVRTQSGLVFITQDHKSCTLKTQKRENIIASNQASVVRIDTVSGTDDFITHQGNLSFANGIALSPNNEWLYIAETRGKRISMFTRDNSKVLSIDVAGGPDNLTNDGNDIYAALIPNLIRFSRFSSGKVKTSPSRFSKITSSFPSKEKLSARSSTMDINVATYDVPASIISGATVAIKAGEHIWLGAAYDTAIARCTLPESPQ